MSTPDERDPERDAWLREALRHAPDAELAAPAALSAAILREAANASAGMRPDAAPATEPTTPAKRPNARSRAIEALASFWSWLGRPPVAAGFASLLVATFVGILWFDRSMEEAVPTAAPTHATPPGPAAAPPSAMTERDVSSNEPPSEPTRSAKRSDARAALRSRADKPEAAARNAAADPSAGTGRSVAAPAPVPPPSSILPTSPNPAETRSAVETSISTLRAQVAEAPQRWSWQRDGSAVRPVDAALLRWLARLEAALPADAESTPGEAKAHDAAPSAGRTTTLRLLRDGQRAAQVRIDADGVEIETTDPPMRQRSTLTPEASDSLLDSIPPLKR